MPLYVLKSTLLACLICSVAFGHGRAALLDPEAINNASLDKLTKSIMVTGLREIAARHSGIAHLGPGGG
jgi:hypothetical protein